MSAQINIGIVKAIVLLVVVILVSAGTTITVLQLLASHQIFFDPPKYEIRWNHAGKEDTLFGDILVYADQFFTNPEDKVFMVADIRDGGVELFVGRITRNTEGKPKAETRARYSVIDSPREVAVRLKQSEVLP